MKEIPGPDSMFFFGNSLDFEKSPPLYLLDLYKKYGEIASFKIGPLQCYSLAEPSLVEELLIEKAKLFEKSERGVAVFSRVLGKGLVTSTGELHKQQRKLMQPAFRKKYLDGYAEAMIYFTEQRKNMWSPGQQIDLAEEMMELTMFIVAKTLFDLDVGEKAKIVYESFAQLQELTEKDMSSPVLVPTFIPTRANQKRKRLLSVLDEIVMDIIQQHRNQPPEQKQKSFGLMSALFDASQEEGLEPMEDNQLKDELITLFLAGHETTANALTWTWHELMQNPQAQQKLHDEIDEVTKGQPVGLEHVSRLSYTTQVFKEAMRMHPPAWSLIAREPSESTTIGEYLIPKKGMVFISPYVLHHNEKYFPEPHKFRPERFAPHAEKELPRHLYIPFGTGHRICIGRSFAMMEGVLLLASIAQKFQFRSLNDKKVQMLPQITLSIKGGLPAEVQARY